jgi:hypothetical protein
VTRVWPPREPAAASTLYTVEAAAKPAVVAAAAARSDLAPQRIVRVAGASKRVLVTLFIQ